MKVRILLGASILLMSVMSFAQTVGQKLPDDISLRIRNVQLDQTRLQNEMIQLGQRYQADQTSIEHDGQELNQLKEEALKTAKLDPAKNDVDFDKLVFINKAAAAKPAEKK